MRVLSLLAASVAAIVPVAYSVAQGGGPSEKSAPSTTPIVSTAGNPVIIKHGSTTLNGTIESPADNEKHAGVVIICPGDEKASQLAKHLAKTFAQKGIIALTYDATEPNVAEANSAIQTLKLRGELRRNEVGIIGVGAAAKLAAEVAKSQDLLYAIAVAPTSEKSIDPASFGKFSKKVLVVRGVEDPFSEKTEKMRQTFERKVRNVTLWMLPDSDIESLDETDSPLLGRIVNWAAARNG